MIKTVVLVLHPPVPNTSPSRLVSGPCIKPHVQTPTKLAPKTFLHVDSSTHTAHLPTSRSQRQRPSHHRHQRQAPTRSTSHHDYRADVRTTGCGIDGRALINGTASSRSSRTASRYTHTHDRRHPNSHLTTFVPTARPRRRDHLPLREERVNIYHPHGKEDKP